MAKDFKIKQQGVGFKTRGAEIASATVIEAGDLVELSSNLIIKADTDSTKVAYAVNGSADGETTIEVTQGTDFTLVGTGDAVWAESYRGTAAGIVGTTNLLIDVTGASSGIIELGVAEDSGVIGSTDNIEFKIVKPIFE